MCRPVLPPLSDVVRPSSRRQASKAWRHSRTCNTKRVTEMRRAVCAVIAPKRALAIMGLLRQVSASVTDHQELVIPDGQQN